MSFKLTQVVPWGRSLAEYRKFFNLSDEDLDKRILSVGDGPAGVNAELKILGKKYISYDPIYIFSKEQIQQRIKETYNIIQQETKENYKNFIWKEYENPEELFEIRMKAMSIFLEDFEQGKNEGRYISGELPNLSFANNEFDLVICSHFLFLYTEHFSLKNHLKSIKEMLRVGNEIRIFPLLDLDTKPSVFLKPVIEEMEKMDYLCCIEKVNYEFQVNGNEMLKIIKK